MTHKGGMQIVKIIALLLMGGAFVGATTPGIGDAASVSGEVPLNYQPAGMGIGDTWFLQRGDTTHVFHQQVPKPGTVCPPEDNGAVAHAISKDLIHWQELPVAIRGGDPKARVPYDREYAIFTGSAVEHGGVIFNFYCANDGGNVDGSDRTNKPRWRQSMNLATSKEGIHFEKYSEGNPLIEPTPGKYYNWHEKVAPFPHHAREVDEIGWHPFYQTDPDQLKNYTADVRALLRWLQDVGFKGHCMSTEWNYSALYPRLSDQAAERSWCGSFPTTEMEKAKYVAQAFTRDSGLGIESFFCEMYCPTYGLLDLSLLRRSFDADPIAPLQPQAAYYVTRNLATLLDGLEPATFECAFEGAPPNMESFRFTAPDGRALALWQGGRAKDHCEGIPVDIRLKTACRQAVAGDPVNGVKQDLLIKPVDGGMLIQGLLVGDSPLIIHLIDR